MPSPIQFPIIAQVGFIAFAAAGVYGFVSAAQDGETRRVCSALCALRPNYADRNRTAPDFELPALSGGKVRLSDYRGKTVILNFWTKTCRPCLEEMPSIANLARSLRDHPDVVLLTVSTDDSLEDARDTLRSVLGVDPPFPVLLDIDSKVVGEKYGTKLYPETWFIDPRGVIRARFDGQRDWASALSVDLAESFHGILTCDVGFAGGQIKNDSLGVCGDLVAE
ncbi:MAG TPA: TlpA disulfide reductase family protein [Polyangiaceae bacterium]|nr:TlpA disulfide reductase family protein [Polyangiaceae bacterium]